VDLASLAGLSSAKIPVCKGKDGSVLLKAALSRQGGKSTQVGKTHFAATSLDPQETRILQEFLLLRQVGRRRAVANPKEAAMSSLAIYLIGLVICVAGLAYGAHLLHVPERWIGVGLVVLVGLGVLMGAIKTRQRDSSGS
jgi:hypothetical protein